MSTELDEKGLSRLDFLKASGALVIAFSLPLGLKAGTAEAAAKNALGSVNPTQLDAWLAIGRDGGVTIFMGKVELGMGATTALAQIVAEELDAPIDRVTLVIGDTARTPNQGPTWGSNAVATGGPPLRQVAADARYALLQRAAAHLGVSQSSLTVKNGVVQVKGNSKKSVTYAELIGGKHFNTTVPAKDGGPFAGTIITGGKGTPKKPSQYTVVGKSTPRFDIPEKVSGKFTFVHDVKIPGMLHGRVIRPTGIGSQLISYGKPPAGVQVVREKNFLGVVSANEWDAIQAAQNLAVKWTDWKGLPAMADLNTTLRGMASKYAVNASVGNVGQGLAKAKTVLQATYSTPIESHASLGPSCAIADVKGDSATVWTGTQDPALLQGNIAQFLGIPQDKVRLIWYEAAGCYGRNGCDPATMDAVIMSKLAGKPVRVQWMRWDEHGWDPKGPATLHDLVGGIDAKGNLQAWHHEGWIPSMFDTVFIGTYLAGKTVGLPAMGGWDGPLLYNFPNYEQIAHGEADISKIGGNGLGITSAWLRSPAQYQITFAMEAFMDELAAAAGVDPVQFRLNHLKDSRMTDLLKAVAKKAGWQTRKSPKPHALAATGMATGQGVAISLRGGTYNALVAEVQVDRQSGKIRVTRWVVGQDNGLTINPRAVELTMEAGVTQTTSRALVEQVTFDQSNVTSTDWSKYPILTFEDAPVIETVLINRPEIPASGAGEPACCPVAGAISNAVFDAIGVRIRDLPMRPEAVKAALQQALQAQKAQKLQKGQRA
ncbi:MAG TPA: molybdopterin cofactor-binding domain-containing protein [Chloroflexota bacterium]|nr:molybdopterin cofactor-binding domain-containing protein [Chloroflexota bacterium]